jgi:uncharacterized protein
LTFAERVLALTAIVVVAISLPVHAADGYSGPVIDAHAHIRFGDRDALTPEQGIGTEALRRLDDEAGVGKSALIVMARKGQRAKTREQNNAVIAAAAAGSGRFYAVASVHPDDGADAMRELERVTKLGVKQIKLHPNTQNFDVSSPRVAAVVKKCGQLGLVVLFDSYKPWDTNQLGKLMMLAVEHPESKLVLAHMGFVQFRDTIGFATIEHYGLGKNVWFDLSAIATTFADSPQQAELVWTIRKIGTQRFLFGSDWPIDTPAAAIAAIRKFGFTPAEEKQILHDNAASLLGLR